MLKLTRCWYDDGKITAGQPVYFLATAIQMIELVTVAEGVVMTEISTFNRVRSVVESPEEIMAMPEMAYAMFPSMMIPALTRQQAEDITRRSA